MERPKPHALDQADLVIANTLAAVVVGGDGADANDARCANVKSIVASMPVIQLREPPRLRQLWQV